MMFDMWISMFGDRVFDKHTKSTALWGPVQIMRQLVSHIGQTGIGGIGGISPYHTNNGLSTIPNLAGNKEYTPDNKHPIYKHYISDMPNMGILGYKGLADMKVWGYKCLK